MYDSERVMNHGMDKILLLLLLLLLLPTHV
jgi:hypothetical protein